MENSATSSLSEEVVHLAFVVKASWDEVPEPRSAVCAGDAVGPLTFDEGDVTCGRCITKAQDMWWDLNWPTVMRSSLVF